MAKSGGSGILGDLLLLAVIVVLAILFIEWLKSMQNGKNGGGVSGGGASSGQQQQQVMPFSGKLLSSWTNLVKAFTNGQTLLGLMPTSMPSLNTLIPSIPTIGLSQNFMNSLAQPLDLGGLGGLSTFDPASTALIPSIPLQSFDMSGISFPLQTGG